jgi:hypothetical protein
MHEHKSGAGRFGTASQTGHETFDELRFPRAEISRQREHIAPPRRLSASPAGRDCFFNAV